MSKVWVTRNKQSGVIAMTSFKPIRAKGKFYGPDGKVAELSCYAKHFKRFFGFTPRKGSCKQMNLSLTDIK